MSRTSTSLKKADLEAKASKMKPDQVKANAEAAEDSAWEHYSLDEEEVVEVKSQKTPEGKKTNAMSTPSAKTASEDSSPNKKPSDDPPGRGETGNGSH